MPLANVYLGTLSAHPNPLDWGAENRPAALRPYSDSEYVFFPPSSPAAFCELLDRIRSGEVYARQIEWGCWAAKMSKKKIIDFINDVYAESPYPAQATADFELIWRRRLEELLSFVHALPDNDFAVIAIQDS